jgi:hypothetical protein
MIGIESDDRHQILKKIRKKKDNMPLPGVHCYCTLGTLDSNRGGLSLIAVQWNSQSTKHRPHSICLQACPQYYPVRGRRLLA